MHHSRKKVRYSNIPECSSRLREEYDAIVIATSW